MTKADFVKRLDLVLKVRGVEGKEVARYMGADPATFSKWRTGATKPPGPAKRRAIELILGLPDQFLDGHTPITEAETPRNGLKTPKLGAGGAVMPSYEGRVLQVLDLLTDAILRANQLLASLTTLPEDQEAIDAAFAEKRRGASKRRTGDR